MDKSLMLNEIKKYLKFERDIDFANFLGIKPNVLSNWHSRNTFDLDLIILCKGLNPVIPLQVL